MRPTALVTGAGRGIGRAIAQFLSEDAWVVGLDVAFPDPEAASLSLEVDVRDRAGVQRAVEDIIEEREGIDWVVCAAGIIRDRVSWKMDHEDWDDVIAVNLTGAFNVMRATVPWLRQSDRGRVVMIGSINGIRGRFGQVNYSASKAGLVGLARSFALELARERVTVNVITPGFIETQMTASMPEDIQRRAESTIPIGRKGKPADIASAVRFLCSDDAGFITGAVLPIDGGQLLGQVVE